MRSPLIEELPGESGHARSAAPRRQRRQRNLGIAGLLRHRVGFSAAP